jgi:hypothetical protein
MTLPQTPGPVLALNLTSRGFVFVLFTAPLSPFDWGERVVARIDRHAGTLRAVEVIMERYHPEVIVIEDEAAAARLRGSRAAALYQDMAVLAERMGALSFAYTKEAVFRTFEKYQPQSKHDIAKVIAAHISEFRYHLPAKRRLWAKPSAWQALFDAAALGLTYYAADGQLTIPAPV